jgi:hypothetical protein
MSTRLTDKEKARHDARRLKLLNEHGCLLNAHDEAERKLARKLERERWRKDHPQWCLADLDRMRDFDALSIEHNLAKVGVEGSNPFARSKT